MNAIRPYILAETNWKALKDASVEMAVLPWGATEAHNYHLPYGTDIFEAEHIAAESARLAWDKGAGVMVLPTIPFGVNTGQHDIFLDINLNPSTQYAILKDIITVLNRQGVHKLMVLNSHGGNNFKPLIRELGLEFQDMFLCFSNWFQWGETSEYFEEPGDHAGEMESSLMLHLKPELVLDKVHWGDGKEKKNKIKAFQEGWVWAERPWSQVSEDTGIGNPKPATAEKGERFFKDLTEKMGTLIYDICMADKDALYE